MPEGAEVKRCADQLSQLAKGQLIIDFKATSGKLQRQGVAGLQFLKIFSKVVDVQSFGKVIVMTIAHPEMNDDIYLVSTLGMSGWWYPNEVSSEFADQDAYVSGKGLTKAGDVISKALKHKRFELIFGNGTGVAYTDMRNFGNLFITDRNGLSQKLGDVGLDLLDEATAPEAVVAAWRTAKPTLEIGAILLNQKLAAGLGNIYRAETLYISGIDPRRQIGSLWDEQLLLLAITSKLVLASAYATHGRMLYNLKDLAAPALRIGVYQQLQLPPGQTVSTGKIAGHLVYGRQRDFLGNSVISEEVGGRTMWWCPAVQV